MGDIGYHSELRPAHIHSVDTLESELLIGLLNHWRKLSAGRLMPSRDEIKPQDIRAGLSSTHLYDVVENGTDFRFRLVGSRVFPGLTTEQTGKLVSEHPDPGARMRFSAWLAEVVRTRAPVRGVSVRVTGNILWNQRAETVWLPLGQNGVVEHVLAQTTFETIPPDSPLLRPEA